MGGDGSAKLRARWSERGEQRDGDVAQYHSQGMGRGGSAQEESAGARGDSERKKGGGRKRLTKTDPGLAQGLDRLIEPTTRGDPMSPLRWTCKSTMNLAQALTRHGHPVGAWTVGVMLKEAGYSLQSNRKTKEGGSHPDRNAQFEYINGSVERFQQRGQPVISVDTKKKELVGPFKNGGREWQPKGAPEEVVIHDFVDEQLGKVIPYGVST